MKLYIREATEALLKHVANMPNPEVNLPLYRETIGKWKEREWLRFYERWQEGLEYFPIIVDNMGKTRIDEKKVMEYGKKIGVEYFQHCRLTDPETGEEYVTPIKYLVLDIPGRRLIQHISDKMSTAEHDRTTDHLAGQATGASKAASVSAPELNVILGKNLKVAGVEFVKVRGGDAVAYDAALKQIEETGTFSMEAVTALNSRPKAVDTLHELLLGTGIDSSLKGRYE